MNLIIPPTLDPITESPQPTPSLPDPQEPESDLNTPNSLESSFHSEVTFASTTVFVKDQEQLRSTTVIGKSKGSRENMKTGQGATDNEGKNGAGVTESFDVNGAYIRALNDEQVSLLISSFRPPSSCSTCWLPPPGTPSSEEGITSTRYTLQGFSSFISLHQICQADSPIPWGLSI